MLEAAFNAALHAEKAEAYLQPGRTSIIHSIKYSIL